MPNWRSRYSAACSGVGARWMSRFCASPHFELPAASTSRKLGADRQSLKKFISPVDRHLRVSEVLDWHVADFKLRGKDSAQFHSHLKPIREHFGSWPVIDLTAEAIDAYIEERLEAEKTTLGRASSSGLSSRRSSPRFPTT